MKSSFEIIQNVLLTVIAMGAVAAIVIVIHGLFMLLLAVWNGDNFSENADRKSKIDFGIKEKN